MLFGFCFEFNGPPTRSKFLGRKPFGPRSVTRRAEQAVVGVFITLMECEERRYTPEAAGVLRGSKREEGGGIASKDVMKSAG